MNIDARLMLSIIYYILRNESINGVTRLTRGRKEVIGARYSSLLGNLGFIVSPVAIKFADLDLIATRPINRISTM